MLLFDCNIFHFELLEEIIATVVCIYIGGFTDIHGELDCACLFVEGVEEHVELAAETSRVLVCFHQYGGLTAVPDI